MHTPCRPGGLSMTEARRALYYALNYSEGSGSLLAAMVLVFDAPQVFAFIAREVLQFALG